MDNNILYQDNKSSILLGVNGKRSLVKIIHALNICYFSMKDKFEKENLQIKYCPTDEMWGDFITNPTQGANFRKFKNHVLGGNE